jgi:hypothetical protein
MPWILAVSVPPAVSTTIDVEVTAISPDPVERDVAVDVPDGMHVVAMAVDSGGVRTQAQALSASAASDRFLANVHVRRDPALLEQTDDGRVALHVYPVMRDRPAHVTLTLAHDAAGLDAATSLYAETPPPPLPPHSHIPHVAADPIGVAARTNSLDAREIRDAVQLHEPQLRRCYDVSLQRHPTLAGTAELHFTIAADGAVAASAVEGSLPSADALACLAGEAASWRFHPIDGPIAVNYPLTFQLPR